MTMNWKKVRPEMIDFLTTSLQSFPTQRKMMFGCPVFFVNSNMFAGLHQDNIFIRLSASQQKDLFNKYDEATMFEPIAGRPMKDYAIIPEVLYNDPEQFQKWLNKSFDFVSTLPPKISKKKVRKTT